MKHPVSICADSDILVLAVGGSRKSCGGYTIAGFMQRQRIMFVRHTESHEVGLAVAVVLVAAFGDEEV